MIKHAPQPGQIKLISLDLDGTLLRSDKSIGEATRKALAEAHRRGVHIVLNSGRMRASMETRAALLDFDTYIIAYNGAEVSDLKANGRKILFTQTLPLEVAKKLIKIAKSHNIQVNYYRDNLVLTEVRPAYQRFIELYQARTGSPFKFVEAIEAYYDVEPLKILYVTDPDIRDAMEAKLRPQFNGQAMVTKTDPEYLEFVHPDVDKGTGLENLCRRLNVDLATEVLALGDAHNDRQMLKRAAWGVAMINAYPEVKDVADAHTSLDHNQDGVAEAVKKWVLFI